MGAWLERPRCLLPRHPYYKEDVGVYADHADYHGPGSYDEYDQEPGYYQEDPTYYADEEDPNGGEPFFDDPAPCEEPTATEEADLLNDEKGGLCHCPGSQSYSATGSSGSCESEGGPWIFPCGRQGHRPRQGRNPKRQDQRPLLCVWADGAPFLRMPEALCEWRQSSGGKKGKGKTGKGKQKGKAKY